MDCRVYFPFYWLNDGWMEVILFIVFSIVNYCISKLFLSEFLRSLFVGNVCCCAAERRVNFIQASRYVATTTFASEDDAELNNQELTS